MLSRRSQLGLSIIGALLLLAIGCLSEYVYSTVNRLHAKVTEAHMTRVMNCLEALQPDHVDKESVHTTLRTWGIEYCYKDGWGRPLVIEMWRKKDGTKHYRVVSLGRSGRRSSCCKLSAGHNWDINTVMEDGQWVQLWAF